MTIAVGIQDRPDAAPQTGPWTSDYKIVNSPSFAKGIAAICQLTFAFTGTPFFFPIVCEMRDPRHYTKSLAICQSVATVIYIVIGVVVYYYCGSYVSSPALGSAGKLIKQIAYGIALPGLFVTSTISTHVGQPHLILPRYLYLAYETDGKQILLHSNHARVAASRRKHARALVHLAGLRRSGNRSCIHHRQRDPDFRESHFPSRCPAGYSAGVSAGGVYVVV